MSPFWAPKMMSYLLNCGGRKGCKKGGSFWAHFGTPLDPSFLPGPQGHVQKCQYFIGFRGTFGDATRPLYDLGVQKGSQNGCQNGCKMESILELQKDGIFT